MDDLEQYVFAYFLAFDAKALTFDEKYHRIEDYVVAIEGRISDLTETLPGRIGGRYPNVAAQFVDAMLAGQGLITISDKFAGNFYKFDLNAYRQIVNTLKGTNGIVATAAEVGEKYWEAAFLTLGGDPERSSHPTSDLISVPASDRIVTLSDNSRDEIIPAVDDIIEKIEGLNGEPSARDLQRRISGQIKAGKELLIAGNFKAYALYITLVSGLVELVNRYRDNIIGAAAYDLLLLLANQIYGVG